MIVERFSKNRLKKAFFGCLFAIMGAFSTVVGVANTTPVYADEPEMVETVTAENAEEENTSEVVEETPQEVESVSCQDSLGAIGWLVCPTTGKISEAVDWLYEKIETILVINPVEMKDGSPIYEIWKYMKGITNILFIIFCLVMIYSQITGMGITNYGLKKTLPKLIVAAILVNLSFIICSLAVDASNIIGGSLRGVFNSIEETTLGTMSLGGGMDGGLKLSEMYSSLAGGSALAIGAGVIAFEAGTIWMLIPTVLGAIVAVVIGLITIALRQAVVALLIMISPLAIIAYILPNTDQWFKKWKQLLTKMLVFYPMFSLLFGASSLAGFAIIASAKDGFGLLLGVAVQIFPLFFSWSLMKMSGTVLGTINSKLTSMFARPLATNRAWAESHRELTRQKSLAGNSYMPSVRLAQFLNNRKIAREEEMNEHKATAKNRGLAYAAMRNYKKDGTPSAEGEEAYAEQAKNMEYAKIIEQHKNNMNKGLGQLDAVKNRSSAAQKARLNALDMANVKAADALFAEKTRGEKIEFDNTEGRYRRFDDAINAHFDELHEGQLDYKRHDIKDRIAARTRYDDLSKIMEGDVIGAQYISAAATQAYDTQKKIIESKMQKYFELLPPTKDVEYRLGELTTRSDASKIIDAIIPGLRILNQRGDTDLLKIQLDNLLDEKLGGGIELGTHASQALASFLMFEVKDNDPALRRFGKYINLETANAYNENKRKVAKVTYDEYVKGYHDGEVDLISETNPTGRMYAKKDLKKLIEGTSLDNIERTALSNLDDSLKRAYGYRAGMSGKDWDVEGFLRKREEIQTAFEPAFLSSSLKWLSGSEQINSGVKFWTGYELKQQKEKVNVDGKDVERVMTDENGDPVYKLSPVWKGKEFAGREDMVEEYFRRKTMDYFKDQTTGQILGMRTDYRDPAMEHLVETYLNSSSKDETSDERREKYEKERAEIQSRYGDKSAEEAEKLRSKDLKALKMKLAGKQIRKILGETGKLEQIYRTRRSGAANNAKDWLRGWVGLDDEEAMNREVAFYERERAKQRNEKLGTDSNEGFWTPARIYDEGGRKSIRNNLEKIWKDNEDASPREFYDLIVNKALPSWFPGTYTIVEDKFKKYYDANKDHIDAYTLKDKLDGFLNDPDNYPDA